MVLHHSLGLITFGSHLGYIRDGRTAICFEGMRLLATANLQTVVSKFIRFIITLSSICYTTDSQKYITTKILLIMSSEGKMIWSMNTVKTSVHTQKVTGM